MVGCGRITSDGTEIVWESEQGLESPKRYVKSVDSSSSMVVPWCRMDKRREAQIQKHFGERLRLLLKQKELSQEALALACNLDRSYIGGVERGERNISLVNIHKIAEALGVKARELFDA